MVSAQSSAVDFESLAGALDPRGGGTNKQLTLAVLIGRDQSHRKLILGRGKLLLPINSPKKNCQVCVADAGISVRTSIHPSTPDNGPIRGRGGGSKPHLCASPFFRYSFLLQHAVFLGRNNLRARARNNDFDAVRCVGSITGAVIAI